MITYIYCEMHEFIIFWNEFCWDFRWELRSTDFLPSYWKENKHGDVFWKSAWKCNDTIVTGYSYGDDCQILLLSVTLTLDDVDHRYLIIILSAAGSRVWIQEAQLSPTDCCVSWTWNRAMSHKYSPNCIWKAMQHANNLQGHSRSLEMARIDKLHDLDVYLVSACVRAFACFIV